MANRFRSFLLTVCTLLALYALAMPSALAATPEYRIDVDIKNQIVTVYRLSDDAIVRQMICSSGVKNRTPRGTFRLKTRKSTDRKPWYHISRPWYVRYATRIKGPYLFHSLPYTKPNLSKPVKAEHRKLGTKASHGCVRLAWENAKWISDNCVDGTIVHIFTTGALNKPVKSALMRATYAVGSGLTYDEFLASHYVTREPGALGRGSDGQRVIDLQNRLAGLGMLEGDISGVYDDATISAVLRYQSASGLEPTGIATEAVIHSIMNDDAHTDALSTLQKGVNGPVVTRLQQTLKAIGIYSGEASGLYDEATAEAVNILSIYSGNGGSHKATPAIQSEAALLLDQLNDRFGGEAFGCLLDATTTRTVKTKAKTPLYRSASSGSRKLKTISKGKTVTLLKEGSKYYKVKYGGKTGYIHRNKLKSIYTTRFSICWGIPVQDFGTQTLDEDRIGPAVIALQERLNALGFYAGGSNGRFGSALKEAVIAWQQAEGLDATGSMDVGSQELVMRDGAATGTAVTRSLGSEGPSVAAMQNRLKSLQYYSGECDGCFDQATEQAVRLFTKANGFGERSVASPEIQDAIREQYEFCESEYGSGNYRLSIIELRTQMVKLRKAEKLRKSASTKAGSVKSLKKNACLPLLEKGAKWSRVAYGTRTGWLKNSWLRFYTDVDYVAEFTSPETDGHPDDPALLSAAEDAPESASEDADTQDPGEIDDENDALDVEFDAIEPDRFAGELEPDAEHEAEGDAAGTQTGDPSQVDPDAGIDRGADPENTKASEAPMNDAVEINAG